MKPFYYEMPKNRYRSEVGIIKAILHAIKEHGKPGLLLSSISTLANLSHYIAKEKCQKLSEAGLIDFQHESGRRLIVITERGLAVSGEIQHFTEIAQSIKIRY